MSVLVERDHIGIFGKMNSGKSSIMNLLTQEATSIVDPTPGTTADTKHALIEMHGLGPVKLYDTAGADESDALGQKKRAKAISDIKECDLILLVVDPSREEFSTEREMLARARELEKQVLVIYNLFEEEGQDDVVHVEQEVPLIRFCKSLRIHANDRSYRTSLLSFIISNYSAKNVRTELLPFLERDRHYALIIPMDAETPPGRYLRPQAMVEEYITRNWAYPVSFRLDLGKARSADIAERDEERTRFNQFLSGFKRPPAAVITDSQAIDILHQWCPRTIPLTTFSITMINYFSRGKLASFAEGIRAMRTIQPGDKILIAEACNHSRIGEDIGTVQIPRYIRANHPGMEIEHVFGKGFGEETDLRRYKLIIHCGGCMISAQSLAARIRDLEAVGVPFTNYGIFLSYMQGEDALSRVLESWDIRV